MTNETFNPAWGQGISKAPTATSGSAIIDNRRRDTIVVTNTHATELLYVRTGKGSATATAADYLVMPLTQVSLTKAKDDDYVAYITASGTGSCHIIPGRGF